MNIFQSFFLGILQGITEFLPVSSSGHLVFFQHLFGFDTEKLIFFDLVLHFGTFLSLILVFRKEIFSSLKTPKIFFNFWMPYFLATIPIAIFGGILAITNLTEKIFTENLIPYTFLFTGIMFLIFEVFIYKKIKKQELVSQKTIFKTGFFQVIGLLPGVSRSGITTLGAMSSGLTREKALKTSFYLFFPAVGLAFGEGFLDLIKNGLGETNLVNLIVGLFASFVSGYFAATFLLKMFSKVGLKPFGIYLIILSIVSFFVI